MSHDNNLSSDSKFWLGIWGGIFATILLLVFWGISAAQISAKLDAERFNNALARGADPIVAKCAVYGSYANDAICTLAAAGHPSLAASAAITAGR